MTERRRSKTLPGYAATPLGQQWTPGARGKPADTSTWRPCGGCGRSIPVVEDMAVNGGRLHKTGTVTYVCPHCRHVHLGIPNTTEEARKQTTCFDCKTPLGTAACCHTCGIPRGWMTVRCHHCQHAQPVSAPHMQRPCDMYFLQCVACEKTSDSLCIC